MPLSVQVDKQSNDEIANRLVKDCTVDCNAENCDAQQAAFRLTSQSEDERLVEWRDNCDHYEQFHRNVGNHAQAEYHRGGKEAFQRVIDENATVQAKDHIQIPREVAKSIALDFRAVIYHELFEKEDARRAAAIVGGEPIVLDSQREAKKSREADLAVLEAALDA